MKWWDALNGKKTAIGGTALWLAWALAGAPEAIEADWMLQAIYWLNWVGGILLPGGLLHKGAKAKGWAPQPTGK